MRNNVLISKKLKKSRAERCQAEGEKKCSISGLQVFREEAVKIYSEGCFFVTR